MTTTDNLQLDSARLAQEDIGSPTNWEGPELKPGEKKTIKYKQKEKRNLEKIIDEKQEELEIVKIAYKEAVDFETTETVKRKQMETDIRILEAEIEKLHAQLNAKQERKQKLAIAVNQHVAANRELKKRNEALPVEAPQNTPTVEKKKFAAKFFRQVLPVIMLVLFCVFDGVNMFLNLNNYNYDTVRHGFISAVIFVAVLFTSFGVKFKNTPAFWIAFIVFLSIANVPQFMGKDPKFGLTNLTSSPEHLVIFVLSFAGSILVTLLNLSLKEKKEKLIGEVDAPVKAIETPATQKLNALYGEMDATDNDIVMLEQKITGRHNKIQQIKNDTERETATKTNEKVEAVQSFAAKQKQITNIIEEIRAQIEELQDDCVASIDKYRQEISIHQLIHDFPQKVNYVDIKTITI
jgi:NADH:ubiquinone oxidoreductase subunit 3 (subunit A)